MSPSPIQEELTFRFSPDLHVMDLVISTYPLRVIFYPGQRECRQQGSDTGCELSPRCEYFYPSSALSVVGPLCVTLSLLSMRG